MNITTDQIRKICHQSDMKILVHIVPAMNELLPKYEINARLRLAHFIGQTAEESAGYRTLREYASGAEYENRKDLGNIHPGDGVKYAGRGLLQITGRFWYTHYSKILGIDLVDHPEKASEPYNAVLTACEYWKEHGLNALADHDDIIHITKKINGGLNGLETRKLFTNRAKLFVAQMLETKKV